MSDNKFKSVLVTGAAGFAAEHLIPRLKKLNFEVIGLDRKSKPSSVCDRYIQCDLNDISKDFFSDFCPNIVIHMAASRADWGVSDEEFFRDNVLATRKLLESLDSKKIETFIFISSISVMPQNSDEKIDETSSYGPINSYGISKQKAEKLCLEFKNKNSNVKLITIRPTVLYGPSSPENTGLYRAIDNNIFRMIDGIASKRFAIVGNGKTIKSTAYIENFAEAIIFSFKQSSNRSLYIYSDRPASKIEYLVAIVRKAFGLKGFGLRIPFFIAYPLSYIFDGISFLTKINFPINSSRIKTFTRSTNFYPSEFEKCGFEQSFSTNEAIEKTVNWYKDLKKDYDSKFFLIKDNSK